jgi:hypothetical protein
MQQQIEFTSHVSLPHLRERLEEREKRKTKQQPPKHRCVEELLGGDHQSVDNLSIHFQTLDIRLPPNKSRPSYIMGPIMQKIKSGRGRFEARKPNASLTSSLLELHVPLTPKKKIHNNPNAFLVMPLKIGNQSKVSVNVARTSNRKVWKPVDEVHATLLDEKAEQRLPESATLPVLERGLSVEELSGTFKIVKTESAKPLFPRIPKFSGKRPHTFGSPLKVKDQFEKRNANTAAADSNLFEADMFSAEFSAETGISPWI